MSLTQLLREIRACRICEAMLPHGPRPILRVSKSARLLIISQAPGSKVHQSGIPWDDASGDGLRDWMNLDRSVFYDQRKIAIIPMGFCYPGAEKSGGDSPPRPECASTWHERLLKHMPNLQLTLLVGHYSQARYLGPDRKRTMTETVKAFSEYGPGLFPLPHPSWRSRIWMRKHPWFEQLLIPRLRRAVHNAMVAGGDCSQDASSAHSDLRISPTATLD
jgi:uracil-DNA glycosylase